MKTRDPRLFITALRVLSKSIHQERIALQDITILRCSAHIEEADLPLDELCCRLVKRALGEPGTRLQPTAQPVEAGL
jgi:hypothetical protein